MRISVSYLVLLALIVCGNIRAGAQHMHGSERIAELQKKLAGHKDDTEKVDLLNEISYAYNKINPYEGIKYGTQSLSLAEELQWRKGAARANSCLGANYFSLSDFLNAFNYWHRAVKINEELGNKTGVANNQHNIGNIYFSQKNYPEALKYYESGLKTGKESGNKQLVTNSYSSIGNVYTQMKDYSKALEYHFNALAIDEELGLKSNVASVQTDIGNVYNEQGNYSKALDVLKQALQLKKETGDKNGLAKAFTMTGKVYLHISKHVADGKDVGIYGTVDRNVRQAVIYLDSAVLTAKEIGYLDNLQKNYEYLSDAYKMSGDYQKALEYTERYRSIKDSIYSQENRDQIAMQVAKNEFDKVRFKDNLKLERQKTFTYIGLAGVLLLLGFSFFIVKERRKSEKLLLNILPSDVAAELKQKGVIKARHFDHVTVLFTDFVNFTTASEKMSPQALIDELHTCFKAFDEITAKYGIEKIKTIGDAYLAVSGLPIANAAHAENMVKAAIEINAFMRERLARPGTGTFAMRIGLHSGSVVAGVVGMRKFAYDIWGDTVNTAARMEQNSEAGRINISAATYELVKDKFDCTYRGEIAAKNKGSMKMYFVNSK